MSRTRRGGCCGLLHLTEDNARFVLLAIVLVAYLLVGAAVFHTVEANEEHRMRERFWRAYRDFLELYNGTINATALDDLLYEFGNATTAGVIFKRPRWDFAGSFYFVATVVSTIGYGMTTPQTTVGKILVIIYGFLGCSGAILFFNLFLERIITLLAYALRAFHVWELRRRGVFTRQDSKRGRLRSGDNGSQMSLDDPLDSWKPSVYWVMFYLFMATLVVGSGATALYAAMEDWDYLQALYFCFVSFATIGFGDFVSSQRTEYPHLHLYRAANFMFLVLGCCCIYSLFNVMSIVIKQALNGLIRKLDCRCRRRSKPKGPRPRRNALTFTQVKDTRPPPDPDSDSMYDSDGERRLSGEMICMRDFLGHTKVSLAVMQKQLHESAQNQKSGGTFLLPQRHRESDFTPGKVGPLAIVTSKLEEGGS